MSKRNTFFSFFVALIILFAQIAQPTAVFVFAETNLTMDNAEQTNTLYKTTDLIELSETIKLLPGTYLYGKEIKGNNDFIRIQYDNGFMEISKEKVEMVTEKEAGPLFHNYETNKEYEMITLSEGQSLVSIYPNVKERAQVLQEATYMVSQDDQGRHVIYLGNIKYFVKKESDDSIDNDSEKEAITEEVQQLTDDEINEKEDIIGDKEAVSEDTPKVNDPDQDEQTDHIEKTETQATKQTTKTKTKKEEVRPGEVQLMTTKNMVEVNPWLSSNADFFRVTRDNLVIYDNRGQGLKPIGTLEKGQVYPRVSDYGNWHEIQFGNINGYVYETATIPADGSTINNINHSYTNTSKTFIALNDVTVYDNTSGQLIPFGVINKGVEYPIASDYGNWWRIIYLGRVGYVHKNSVKRTFDSDVKYFRVTAENLPIYDNRTGSLVKVGELTKGQVYPRVSSYGPNWHKIRFGNIYGYVQSYYTESASGNSIRNQAESYNFQERQITPIGDVSVYDNSTGSLIEFAQLEKGISYPKLADYGNWWKVSVAGRIGYVHKGSVRVGFKSGDKYFKVVTDNLSVFDNRGKGLTKVGELRKGQTYPIVSDYGDWWRIKFGDIYGYVYKEGTEYGVKSSIHNLNTRFSHSNTRIKAIQDAEIVTQGSLIPFGELTKGTIYPIATDYGNWWRVIYLGRVGYIHKNAVKKYGITKTQYDLTLEEALAIQMSTNPQTDKDYAYVIDDYIENNKVTVPALNVRSGPGIQYDDIGTLYAGDKVEIIDEINGWYQIKHSDNRQWVNASPKDVLYYLNPLNFINDEVQKFQFLDLSKPSGASASTLNQFLQGKGILSGHGQAFIDAGRINGINDVYLISHALLETGNGTSTLSNGVPVDKDGNVTYVNGEPGVTSETVDKVYNMYGVHAFDGCALECGAKKAFEEGWDTPAKAIIGGAKFIGNNYIKGLNYYNTVQNTIYKMRWNPIYMATEGTFAHQYATDVGWAAKQVYSIYNLYQQLESYTLILDIPVYMQY